MKKIAILTSVVCLLGLFSFTIANSNLKAADVFIVKDDVIYLTRQGSRVVSTADMITLSQNVAGWTACDVQSTANDCYTRMQTFPDKLEQRKIVEEIIAKYND